METKGFVNRMYSGFKSKKILFCFLVFATLLLLILRAIMQNGESNRWVFFYDENDTFMDFFNSIYDSRFANPYMERGVIYPPLTYLVYRIFGHMIPAAVYPMGAAALRSHQAGLMAYTFYTGVSLAALFCGMYAFIRRWDQKPWLLMAAVVLSSPVLYAYERGNLLYITVAMLLIYLAWYDSGNKIHREIALLALAVAANFKIFPAVFGLLLLQKKEWKEAFRCVLYAMILLLAPMFLFGGLSNIPVLIGNILSTSDGFNNISKTRVDIGNIFRFLSEHGVFPGLFSAMAKYCMPVGALVLLLCTLLTRDEGKRIIALSLICVALPGFSWMYNLMYYVPAMLYFICQRDRSRLKSIYYFMLMLMFLYYPFNVLKLSFLAIDNSGYTYRLWDLLSTGLNLVLALMIIVDTLWENLSGKNQTIQFLTPVRQEDGPCETEGQIVFSVSHHGKEHKS